MATLGENNKKIFANIFVLWLFPSFLLLSSVFEIGSHYAVLTILEFTMQNRLALNSQVCLPTPPESGYLRLMQPDLAFPSIFKYENY